MGKQGVEEKSKDIKPTYPVKVETRLLGWEWSRGGVLLVSSSGLPELLDKKI